MDVSVRGALWLADLKFRAWVPVLGEDGERVKMLANATTLKDLLHPTWLEKNHAAIKLLSEWFEFDELDLRLLGVSDAEKRRQLRNELAKLVELGGSDLEFYASLADEVEAQKRRSREVDRCRRLGIGVQEAIKAAMERYGLKLKLIDKGFDYEVEFEDASTTFEIGPYLLEVKATTTGNARLTPTQARTASQNASRYVLCVVDLRGLSEEELDADWTSARVEPLANIVPDIGGKVKETCLWIDEAKTSLVPIRNESALRYEVSVSIWEKGLSVSDWVAGTLNQLTKSSQT